MNKKWNRVTSEKLRWCAATLLDIVRIVSHPSVRAVCPFSEATSQKGFKIPIHNLRRSSLGKTQPAKADLKWNKRSAEIYLACRTWQRQTKAVNRILSTSNPRHHDDHWTWKHPLTGLLRKFSMLDASSSKKQMFPTFRCRRALWCSRAPFAKHAWIIQTHLKMHRTTTSCGTTTKLLTPVYFQLPSNTSWAATPRQRRRRGGSPNCAQASQH